MYNICIIGDYGYWTRVVLLCQSICLYNPQAHIYFLAMDEKVFEIANSIGSNNLTVIPLSDVETPELTEARGNRNWIEWVWLFQPAFPLHLLENYNIDHIFWMDGDIWVYDSLKQMYDEIGSADVAVSPHRFPPHRDSAGSVSIFNGGATYFRKTKRGVACCKQWLADCIEWDFWWTQPKPGPKRGQKGGTQGYLDFWPSDWNAKIVTHLGCNLAPWNQDHPDYRYEKQGNKILISGQPLIFYHFQDFKPEKGLLAGPEIIPFVRKHIYGPYIRAYNLKKLLWKPTEVAKDLNKRAI